MSRSSLPLLKAQSRARSLQQSAKRVSRSPVLSSSPAPWPRSPSLRSSGSSASTSAWWCYRTPAASCAPTFSQHLLATLTPKTPQWPRTPSARDVRRVRAGRARSAALCSSSPPRSTGSVARRTKARTSGCVPPVDVSAAGRIFASRFLSQVLARGNAAQEVALALLLHPRT